MASILLSFTIHSSRGPKVQLCIVGYNILQVSLKRVKYKIEQGTLKHPVTFLKEEITDEQSLKFTCVHFVSMVIIF